MTNEEEEPTKYKVIFEGCNHERIMSAQELLNPSRQTFDGTKSRREDEYLCWSCLKEEQGACAISPYHKIRVATRLR